MAGDSNGAVGQDVELLSSEHRQDTSDRRLGLVVGGLVVGLVAVAFLMLSRSPRVDDETPGSLTRPYSESELLAGVTLLVDDPGEVVRDATLYVSADLEALRDDIDIERRDLVMVSFSLSLCERLPRLVVAFDDVTQAMGIEVSDQEGLACHEPPREVALQLSLERGVEIRSIKIGS